MRSELAGVSCVLPCTRHPSGNAGSTAGALQWCHLCPSPTKAIRSNLLSRLLQGHQLVAARLYWAKASEHGDRTRCWLPF